MPAVEHQLATGQNLVLQAEPGAGKSTALPLSLLDAEWLQGKKILMLEPRRVAAKSIAHYLAAQLGEKVGGRIGYQIKNDRNISSDTVLEIVTEGVLTRRLQNDPEIASTGLIIFDEFHERSIHADLSLLLCLEIQQTIREDLKLLVMSATIDTDLVARYMGGANVISCPGRAFPVSVEYRHGHKRPLADQVVSAVQSALNSDTSGDVLVFLPGQGEINKCLNGARKLLNGDQNLLLCPLYGGLSLSQQEQALRPDPQGRRRVVFATNIAETSLTIEGVTWVVDSGLEKVLLYDPASCMTRLETQSISRASATQRKGRAGRTGPGSCIRLWSEQQQRSLRNYQGEEICSADLTSVLLELSLWGAGDYTTINWLTPPPEAHYHSAQTTLVSLGLLSSAGKVTPLGEQAVGMGLSPRLATMLLNADDTAEQGMACELAALLSDRDIFIGRSRVDIVERLMAVQDYKEHPRNALTLYPLNRASVESLLVSATSLRRKLKIKRPSSTFSLSQWQTSIGQLLLSAYPDRLAKRRSINSGRYQLANGKGVFLFEEDSLFNSEWLVVADCDAQKKEGRIYSAAAVSYPSIEAGLQKAIVIREQYGFDRAKDKITGQRLSQYGAIIIKSTAISGIPAEQFQTWLRKLLREEGLDILNWTEGCEQWLCRARWLGENCPAFPYLSKTRLIETVDEWLTPYLSGVNSIASLKRVDIFELLSGILSWQEQQFLQREAPAQYRTPSGKVMPIDYRNQQGPVVSVQLQELFGLLDSPQLAAGTVALRFELLSPARRPIQVTSDLGNFWQTSYFEVAKEMRGKYPKHRWPEQPLLAKAGKSIKQVKK